MKEPKCLKFKKEENSTIPENCTSWFDGCNNCIANDGKITACTKKFCYEY